MYVFAMKSCLKLGVLGADTLIVPANLEVGLRNFVVLILVGRNSPLIGECIM